MRLLDIISIFFLVNYGNLTWALNRFHLCLSGMTILEVVSVMIIMIAIIWKMVKVGNLYIINSKTKKRYHWHWCWYCTMLDIFTREKLQRNYVIGYYDYMVPNYSPVRLSACLDQLIYWHQHLWDCLRELVETTYDTCIGCFQFIFIASAG
jgi:hypothetical protein